MSIITKFRAFQLTSEGSLFSFYDQNHYTLVEARIPKGGIDVLKSDLAHHGKTAINLLHITSWDKDHCNYHELVQILNTFRPALIHVPSYEPDTDEGKLCRSVIFKYDDVHQKYVNNVKVVDRQYINSRQAASAWGTNDVVYHSMYNAECKNDMSLIRFFRSTGFSVLSLGDCESSDISQRLQRHSLLTTEVDVLILPHHGADNGFTTAEFLDAVNPRMAICSSNYDNKFEHPDPAICNLLLARGIPIMTTKRGDVIIFQRENEGAAHAINMIADNEKAGEGKSFAPKRISDNQKAA